MEITTLVIGVLIGFMALSNRRIIFILKIILCISTSYLPLKIIYHDLRLWSFNEYNDNNFKILFHSNLFTLGIIISSLLYFILYVSLPKVLSIFMDKRERKIYGIYTSLTSDDINTITVISEKYLRKIYKLTLRYFKKPMKIINEEEILTYNQFNHIINSFFCITINLIIVLIFVIKLNTLFMCIISLMTILIYWLFIRIIPVYLHAKKLISNVYIDEHNSLVR